jgi:hypothetical protein
VSLLKPLLLLGACAAALLLAGCSSGADPSPRAATPEEEQAHLKRLNKMIMPENEPKGAKKARRR